MPRKWTDEEKAAFGLKMKAAREKKLQEAVSLPDEKVELPNQEVQTAEQVEQPIIEPAPAPAEPSATTVISEMNTEQLLRHALEAITNLTANQASNGAQVANGAAVGTTTKYSIDPADYPSPIERLMNEPSLARFGFKDNYELTFLVDKVRYQTIDKIWMEEPKLFLDLIRIVYNEETGEKTNGRYFEYRLIVHEDPESAIWVARQNNIDVDNYNQTELLNEMRYLQMRDWLFECFIPKKPKNNNNLKQVVIGGKLVQYFEINSEDNQAIPFSQLNSKVK